MNFFPGRKMNESAGWYFPTTARAMKLAAIRRNVIFASLLLAVSAILLPHAGQASSLSSPSSSHAAGDTFNTKRLAWVTGAHIVGFTGALIILDQAWYSDHPRSSFHFFDDSKDWKQMDKMGHIASTYHLSRFSHKSFRWSGLSNGQSALWGSISGTLFLTTIEILDGFSAEWGASWSDMAANLLGSGTFYVQQRTWQEQKILWKYSYSSSGMAQYRPDLLGASTGERLLKDYNGMTFWLSFNLPSLTNSDYNVPPWLNLALGYGAHGLLGSTHNPAFQNGEPLPHYHRYRSWYLAPDIDFSRIPTQSGFLQQVFSVMNIVKLPAPAIEYNSYNGWQWHWVFF